MSLMPKVITVVIFIISKFMLSISDFICCYSKSKALILLTMAGDCATVRLLREELQLLQESGSYVGEVVKAMDKKKVLVKVFHS